MVDQSKEFIWYERHRPQQLDDMTLPPHYRKTFENYVTSKEIPHLMFHGPQGSGKTTLAFVLMQSIPCVRLTLNASSADRGIETMRTKVKTFASSQTIDGRLKIVFFDEADGITQEAQNALRNTIEAYSSSCRFIFTCNEIAKMIPPLMSRCTIFEFSAFPVQEVTKQCQKILESEQVKYQPETLQKIVDYYYPDIRSIVNNLQLNSEDGVLSAEKVSKVVVDPGLLVDYIVDGEVGKIRTMLVGVSSFVNLYKYLFDSLLSVEDLSSQEKSEVVRILSEGLYRDAVVANREIVFIDTCISIISVIKCPKISFSL